MAQKTGEVSGFGGVNHVPVTEWLSLRAGAGKQRVNNLLFTQGCAVLQQQQAENSHGAEMGLTEAGKERRKRKCQPWSREQQKIECCSQGGVG